MEVKRNNAIRIGDVLKEFGYVTEDQIGQAISYQKEHKGVLMGGALIALGFINERQMLDALGRKLDHEVVNVGDLHVDIKSVERIPKALAEKYCMLPYAEDEQALYLIVNDPLNFYGIEDIRQITGAQLVIKLCEKAQLENAIQYYYSEGSKEFQLRRADSGSECG